MCELAPRPVDSQQVERLRVNGPGAANRCQKGTRRMYLMGDFWRSSGHASIDFRHAGGEPQAAFHASFLRESTNPPQPKEEGKFSAPRMWLGYAWRRAGWIAMHLAQLLSRLQV